MSGRKIAMGLFALGLIALVAAPLANGANEAPVDAKQYQQVVSKAIDFLATTGQAPDGSYSASASPAVTALVTAGILRAGRTPDDPLVAKSLKFLEGFVQPDGGIYTPTSTHRNYETSIAMVCFAEANRDGRYKDLLAKAEGFVKGLQWDENEGHDRSSVNFGGAGYGSKKRPDLSNTSFLIDALRAAGKGPDDPALQKALVFVSRCQNLESEHNTTPFAAKVEDGGFYYTPAAGGSSMAGETDAGGLRSYGSMTYAGLKSMIFAGVGPDDPRVKAAFDWAQKHYSLAENPGMGEAGLYYYYHTFAKALDALGTDQIKDASGAEHNWRSELLSALAKRQRPDGAWVNSTTRWMEGDPNLVTGYALLTLSYLKPGE